MAAYATVDELNEFFDSERVVDTATKELALLAARQYIDTSCKRSFDVAEATATARKYVPTRFDDTLWIHDCTEITSVVENGNTLTVDVNYYAYPLNGVSDAGETRPYYKLVRHLLPWYTNGQQPTVTVTAKWGWAATPDPIKWANLVLAKVYLDSRNEASGLAAITEVGISRGVDAKSVRDALDHYRHARVGMVR